MPLTTQSLDAIRQFASRQAAFHGGVVAEVGKILRTQSVTQPNSRSTIELHAYAVREQRTGAQWARLAGRS